MSTPSQVQVAAGSRHDGIVHEVQPRSATCSSQASLAMFPRPYATMSARYGVILFGNRASHSAATISIRPWRP